MPIKHLVLGICAAGMLAGCEGQATSPSGRAYTVSGVISEVTPAGAVPVAGVKVVETTTHRSALTDAAGRYRLASLVASSTTAMVTATKPGFVTQSKAFVISSDSMVDIQIDRRPTYSLSGVISEMTPTGRMGIKGVTVEFLSWVANDHYSSGSTTTDENGRYHLSGLWSGSEVYTGIWLIKEGYQIDPQQNPSCHGCFRMLAITGDTVLDVELTRLSLDHPAQKPDGHSNPDPR